MRAHGNILASASLSASLLLSGSTAFAQVLQRFSLQLEGGVGRMLTAPPSRHFGLGGEGSARISVRVIGPLAVDLGYSSWWFRNLDPSIQHPPPGQISEFAGGFRVAHHFSERLVGGPFIDGHVGLALTGGLRRLVFDAALGWEFVLHPAVNAGVFARYAQVVQPDVEPLPQDARALVGGVFVSLHIPPPRIVEQHEADADGDGIPDASDHCPQQPEDRDHFEDSDGCRDPDNDEDGILDARDLCPFESESRNHYQDDDGCPDDAPVAVAEVRNDRIEISQSVRFELGTAVIAPASYPILLEVTQLLVSHPEISRVRVEGHADERGDVEFNERLSSLRANAVVSFLREHGALDADLEPEGFGTRRPLCQLRTERCYALNRRVEFVIVEITHQPGASSSPAPSTSPANGAPVSTSPPAAAPPTGGHRDSTR